MTVIQSLDQHYIDTQLICPLGKARIEIVDPERTGLYIEVRAASPGQGTYYLRYKNSNGKTQHHKIGRTSEIQLNGARAEGARFKASIGKVTATANAPATSELIVDNPALGSSLGVMTLDVFMTEHYLPHAQLHKRSHWRDEQLYRLRIKPKFGHLPLADIKRREVQQFQSALVAGGLSNASSNHHVQLLRHVCNLAVSWEMLDRNVLKGIPLLALDNQVDNNLDPQQVDRLVEVLKTDKNRMVCLILMFLLATGARRSEALTAEWRQVDVENRVWTISATNSKSKKQKHLPLNDAALWVIKQLETKGESALLFPSPVSGKPFTTIARQWWRLRKKAGLPSNIRIHDLRHTFASRLVTAGRSLYEVQNLLGHADPRTTMRYAHLSMDAKRAASNAAAFTVA